MDSQRPNIAQHAIAQSKYASARANLLMVVALTAINLIFSAAQTDIYFLFAADLPLFVINFGQALFAETNFMPLLIAFVLIGILLSVPYLICWHFSKKHYGWMIGALIYFAFDCAFLLLVFLLSFDVSLLIDIAFHAWVLFYLISGVKYGKQLKELPEQPIAPLQGEGPVAALPETSPIRTAGTEEKVKIYLQATVGAHTVIYRKYGKHTEELVIDGQVYAEYRFQGPIAKPNSLAAVIDGMQIFAGYYQKNYIIVNGECIAQSIRWI